DYDFAYQVSVSANSTDSIGRLTALSFFGFQTDVGYTVNGSVLPGGVFSDGTVAPELVDRVGTGDVIGFSFNAPLTQLIGPGQTSAVLVTATDATSYAAGSFNLIDGGTTTLPAFQPAGTPTPAPEPASLFLLGGGPALLTRRSLLRKPRRT